MSLEGSIGGAHNVEPAAVAGSDRWSAALSNVSQIGGVVESLSGLLLHKAVYMDEEAFGHAASNARQSRNAVAQERRIRALEKELDSAIAAARQARVEKKRAESLQRAAEAHCQEVLQELENTTKVFKLHLEEFRKKEEDLTRKDSEIQVLKAIIQTMTKA
ncbi:hypothetical protein SELMODRAFT_114499 [Selaginella moellendorffii]|uniref:Uncharacterized protein n=1 Tax=Selaginella moellendorffii TaxID=88036 RepID=D8SD95_SELML|nr:myosin-17 [Selaginella moellendorffii]EFJ17584.1 hypothetical protein SELMODRAFT_114499 [Selaginella moellendorffii]|eukprot:XP_002981396.1 myosin-17 [Selaginella moellendorffii]